MTSTTVPLTGENMTYRLESFIKRITSPVICIFGEQEVSYADGKALYEQPFDKFWTVDTISVRDGKVILQMTENDQINTSDSEYSFF